MRKTFLCVVLAIISIFSFSLWACSPAGDGDTGPVANAELDEYNQIVNQIKDVFTQDLTQPQPMSKGVSTGISAFNSTVLLESSNQDAISLMFSKMNSDSTKKQSQDDDYYAYGIDFSTMTARIAGYAANNFFKVSSFYDLNILMDYGGNTVINACVKKENNIIKTYIFTTFKNTHGQLFKEYNYAEINFTSQTDFNVLVVDYVYDEQNVNTSKTMIYASNKKDFFLMSGEVDDMSTSMLFFNTGDNAPAYMIEGKNSNIITDLFVLMDENFALSNQEKNFIGNLYNTQNYSITYKQVTQAKTDLGIIIDMESEEYVPPIGFVSNKNAQDLVGRKTLQAFVDDGQSVDGTTLTIPSEFNYLSGGIYFNADIDTLVIPSTIKGVVVYDRFGNYYHLDDSLCYYEPADEYDAGRYRAWGGTLFSYVADQNDEFWIQNTKPFKKYILLDDLGNPTKETDAFALDEIGNLWIKDSNGNKNYLWGFVSEPAENANIIYLPSPIFVTKDRYIQVERFACQDFMQGLKNIGKMDEYSAHFKHAVIDGYVDEQSNSQTDLMSGFHLLKNPFFVSFEYEETGIMGFKWDLETLTINNIIDGARVSLLEVFCSESGRLDEYGYPCGDTVCQAKVKKVILNGDFDSIVYTNGYCETPRPTFIPGGNGMGTVKPDDSYEITATYAISEDYELNGRENAYLNQQSVVYGKKVVEIYGTEEEFPSYPDAEKLLIKSSVTQLSINHSLLQVGMYSMPEDRKLTIEFENIAGIDFDWFYINDFMYEGSTKVEKVKFNVSQLYMENLIRNLEGNPNADWLNETVNSGKFEIEFADALPGEQEFLENYYIYSNGDVSLKEDSSLSTVEINDEFLSIIKQVVGKDFSQIRIFFNNSQNDVKIILNISKNFFDDNDGLIPEIMGGSIVDVSNQMKEFDDLTLILDKIKPNDNAKLLFNGSKEELVSRTGTAGVNYITKLLYSSYYYNQIVFSDNQTLYRDINDKIVTYEDERVKIVVTYSGEEVADISFEDKLYKNVYFNNSKGEAYGEDDNNSWYVTIRYGYSQSQTITYNDQEITIPCYRLSIYYYYGHNTDGDFNFVYGTYDEYYKVDFMIHMLPTTMTIE